MQPSVAFAGIIGLSIILSVTVYMAARLRIEQERTLQKLIERGTAGDDVNRLLGLPRRRQTDLRRGLLLVALGLAWSAGTFFAGGKAWMMGIVPIVFGAVFALLQVLDDRSR